MIRVRVITFNLGNQSLLHQKWISELKKDWIPSILNPDSFDILCVALQEDYQNVHSGGSLGRAIEAVLKPHMFSLLKEEQSGPLLAGIKYVIKANIYVRSSFLTDFTPTNQLGIIKHVQTEKTCFGVSVVHKTICTKSCIGIALQTQSSTNKTKNGLIFVAAHLPIDVSDPQTLGLNARRQALGQMFDKVVQPLHNTLNKNNVNVNTKINVIVAGDLNFRRTGDERRDQLSSLLQSDSLFLQSAFGKWKEAGPLTFAPTCKYQVCSHAQSSVLSCSTCRTQNETIHKTGRPANVSCYTLKTKKGDERLPSHCDRVIYTGKQLIPMSYKDWGDAKTVLASDHNAVYADFEWDISDFGLQRTQQLQQAASVL